MVNLEMQNNRKRHMQYAAIMGRAIVLELMTPEQDVDRMMDIESADMSKREHSSRLPGMAIRY